MPEDNAFSCSGICQDMGDCKNAMFGWNGGFETSPVTDAGRFRPVDVKVGIKNWEEARSSAQEKHKTETRLPPRRDNALPNCCQPDITYHSKLSRSHGCRGFQSIIVVSTYYGSRVVSLKQGV